MFSVKNNQQGYIALIAVIIVVAATLAISLSLNILGIGETQMGLLIEQSSHSFVTADACMHEAYMRLKRDGSYAGGSLNIGDGSCTIVVADSGADKRVTVTADYKNIQHTFESLVTVSGYTVVQQYWKELTE